MRSKKSLSDTQPEHSTTIHHGERDRIGQNLQHWQHTLPAPSDRECWMKFWKYELTKQCPRRFSLHKIYSFSYSGGLSIVAGWYRNTNVCIQYWELRLQTLSGGKAWYNFDSVVFQSNDKAVSCCRVVCRVPVRWISVIQILKQITARRLQTSGSRALLYMIEMEIPLELVLRRIWTYDSHWNIWIHYKYYATPSP